MSEIKGRYIELIDESCSRVLFSAAIPTLDKEVFLKMWGLVGDMLYEKQQADREGYYRIRLASIQTFG